MTTDPATELARLKAALRLWGNAKTYEEGCKRWATLCELMGEPVPAVRTKQEKAD